MPQDRIRPARPDEPDAADLLAQSQALMDSLFPSEANHVLSTDALAAPDVRFFVAERDGQAVGCAALALRDGYGEVKSMFVAPAARGTGLGARLVACLADTARGLGLPMLRLETGVGLDAAHALYRRAGFAECNAFGAYAANAPYSLYMERRV